MRTVSRRGRWSLSLLLVFTLLSICSPLRVRADGGAPNLAYVSGSSSGVNVIDVLQGKVTKIISVAGMDALTILDGLTEQQVGKIPLPSGPQYLSIPPGVAVYVTTRQRTCSSSKPSFHSQPSFYPIHPHKFMVYHSYGIVISVPTP